MEQVNVLLDIDRAHHRKVIHDERQDLDAEGDLKHRLHVNVQELQTLLLTLHDTQHIRVTHIPNVLSFDIINVVLFHHPSDLLFHRGSEDRLVTKVLKCIKVLEGVGDIVHIDHPLDAEQCSD